MRFTKINGTCETDVKEGHDDDDKKTGSPDGASKPESNSCKSIIPDSRVGGTTKGLGDNLPGEYDDSKNVASSKPKVSLFGRSQLLEVWETEFGL